MRGFGAKNVVFCGMRTRASAAARIWGTVTGGSRIAASTSPRGDHRRNRGGVVAVRDVVGRERVARHGLEPRGRDVDEHRLELGAGGVERRGVGHEPGHALGVHQAHAAPGAEPLDEGRDRLGGVRRGVEDAAVRADVESEPGGGSDAVEQAVDRLDPELVLGELHDEAQDRVVAAGGRAVRRAARRGR